MSDLYRWPLSSRCSGARARCSAEKDGLICTTGAGHAPADHAGHGPLGEVIGHWRPDSEPAKPFRHLAAVEDGEPR